jgi:hypothetical protein
MAAEEKTETTEETIDLKEPGIAALLAWLVPGLGHFYQGRRAKAVLYFVCIMGLYVFGLYLGGSSTLGYGRAVYCAWRPGDQRLYYFGQIGIGAAAMPALFQANRMAKQQPVWFGGFMAPPRADNARTDGPNGDQPNLGDLHRQLHHYFELATFFTFIAGLLNILAIYDAYAGPVASVPEESQEEANDTNDNPK